LRLVNALANTLTRLGSIVCETGEDARASELYRESLEVIQRFGFRVETVACLEGFARVAVMQGRPERAARLLGASTTLREEMSTPLSPVAQADHDHATNAAYAALNEDALAAAWAEGGAMSFEEAIAAALDEEQGANDKGGRNE
jgi:hypothetical protein